MMKAVRSVCCIKVHLLSYPALIFLASPPPPPPRLSFSTLPLASSFLLPLLLYPLFFSFQGWAKALRQWVIRHGIIKGRVFQSLGYLHRAQYEFRATLKLARGYTPIMEGDTPRTLSYHLIYTSYQPPRPQPLS